MKKIITLLLLLNFCIINAQTPIINLEDKDGSRLNGAYYKDIDSVFNNYEGVWEYSNGLDTLKIELRKITFQFLGRYYEDVLVGEIKYVKNGVEKANTLSEINANYGKEKRHTISGNTILTSPQRLNCTDCAPGEKRVYLGFKDPNPSVGRAGYIIFKKTTVANQEAIKIFIGYAGVRKRDGEIIPETTIPYGWYTLIKQ